METDNDNTRREHIMTEQPTTPDKEKELAAYANSVAALARKREDHVFFNSGDDHARIVFENIFINATDCVYIVAGDLTNEEVANSPVYLNAVEQFLDRDKTSLHILVSDFDRDTAMKTEFFKLIARYDDTPGKIEVHSLNGTSIYYNPQPNDPESKKEKVHFCFADGQMYRLETDTRRRRAQVNFNDPNAAEVLMKVYSLFVKDSSPVSLA